MLERIGEDQPEDEAIFRDLWEDEAEKDTVLEILKAEYEVRLPALFKLGEPLAYSDAGGRRLVTIGLSHDARTYPLLGPP